MALKRELAVYRRRLPELTSNEGRFVLIHGEDVVDTYSSYDDAIKEGYGKFGLLPFLVKQIQTVEQVPFVTRFVAPHTSALD